MSSLNIHQVPEGSILVFNGIEFEDDTMDWTMKVIAKTIGHMNFCIVELHDSGSIEVWGPDTNIKSKIEELLNGAEEEV